MYRKWGKVLWHYKLSSISAAVAISVTVAIMILFCQTAAAFLSASNDIKLETANYDWAYSGLTAEQMSVLSDADARKDIELRGLVQENRIGTYRDELGLELEWLEVEGDLNLVLGTNLTSGRLPVSGEEVCITRTYLDRTGLDLGIGDVIAADVTNEHGDIVSRKATIVGILDRYASMSSSYCTISGTSQSPVPEDARTCTVYCLAPDTAVYEEIYRALAQMNYLLTGVTDYRSLEPNGISCTSNYTVDAKLYTRDQSIYQLIPAVLAISVLFFLISLLFIRMLIGAMLTLRKRDYGILLALGLSKKRMRTVLFFEAALFTASGVLPGLLLGAWMLRISHDALRQATITGYLSSEWSWSASLAAVAVVFFGVFLAYGTLYRNLRKSQPYSFFAQNQDTAGVQMKKQKPIRGSGVLFITLRNLERNAWRTFGILALLAITSGIIMTSIYFVSSMNQLGVNYISGLTGTLSSDYSLIADTKNGQYFSKELIVNTGGIDDILAVYPIGTADMKVNGFPCILSVYTEEQMKGANLPVQDTPLLYAEDLSSMISSSGYQRHNFATGEQVRLETEGELLLANAGISGTAEHYVFYDEGYAAAERMICNEAFAKKYLKDVPLHCSTILVRTGLSYMDLEKSLAARPYWNNGFKISFYKNGTAEAENQYHALTALSGLLGGTLMVFVLLCLLNMGHQICLLRSKEYALLQAIGYRKKDISKIAALEITIPAFLAAALSVWSVLMIHSVMKVAGEIVFPAGWILLYAAALIALSWSCNYSICQKILKKSMYERLCEVER